MKIQGIEKFFNIFEGEHDNQEIYQEVFLVSRELLEHLFEHYFEKVEGNAFSGDKAHFTTKKVWNALQTKDRHSLKGRENWSPQSLKNTDEALQFAFAVISLDFKTAETFMEQARQTLKTKED